MEASLTSLVGLSAWLLRVSAQASIAIGLVLLAQLVFRKWLSPRWRYRLWLLVLIRLLLPVSSGSAFSVFNYTQRVTGFGSSILTSESLPRESLPSAKFPVMALASPSATIATEVGASAPSQEIPVPAAIVPTASDGREIVGSKKVALPAVNPDPGAQTVSSARIPTTKLQPAEKAVRAPGRPDAAAHARSTPSLRTCLSWLWLVGALSLAVRIFLIPVRLNAQLAQHETATAPAVFEVLEQSKRLMRMHRVLPIIQSRAVSSPALLGFIRPWLLLPDGMVERFTAEELRFVFLHELAHLKRRDIAVNWLMTILQILHWFNPLVWFAFARMRADRELACDELALSFAKADENKAYGRAIIKLLEGFARPAVLPSLVGILEDKQQMKRRIIMIAEFKKMTRWSGVAFALLLTLGLVTLTDAQSSKTGPEQTSKPAAEAVGGATVKFLHGVGGTLSPDESMISYADWKSTTSADIVVKNLATGNQWKITKADTNTPGIYEFASDASVWSPDSKWIAYDWYIGGAKPELRIASVTGGKIRAIKSHNPEIEYDPLDWSPDGQYLLCVIQKQDFSQALGTVSVESGEVHQLISLQWNGARHPRFSPDGRFIVFERTEDGNRDVFVLAVDGSQVTRLTDSPAEDCTPVWSADGKHVLFSSNRREHWDLWAVEVKDGKAAQAPFPVKYDFGDYGKRLTRSGKLVFDISSQNQDVYSLELNPTTGEVAGPKLITRAFYGQHTRPVWSPDGKRLAYIRNGHDRPKIPRVCINSMIDGQEECLDAGMRMINRIIWSPDGKSMAVSPAGPKGQYGIHLYSLETRQLRPIIQISDFRPKGFTADGKEFVLFKPSGTTGDFVAIDLVTRKERKLLFPDHLRGNASLSPDQSRAVYLATDPASQEQKLMVSDSRPGEGRILARFGEKEKVSDLRWSPDGSKITFICSTTQGTTELRVISADGGNPKIIDLESPKPGNNLGCYLSPDGTRIALASAAQNGTAELRLRALEGGWEKLISTGNKRMVLAPEWSPDSTKLALTLADPEFSEIGIMEDFLPKEKLAARSEAKSAAESSGESVLRTLVSGPNVFGNLSPDESKVVYTVWTAASGDLTVKDLMTKNIAQLTKHETNRTDNVYEMAMYPVWSPDARWIAYGFALDGAVTQDYSVRIVPAEGGKSRVVKSSADTWFEPNDWAPDGKSLLCVLHTLTGNSMALGIVSVESGEVRQLISMGWNAVGHTRFSPDGRSIVYAREENGNRDIYVLVLDGMRVTRLTDLPSAESSPVWSADGTCVLFSSDRSGPPDLWAVKVKNGEAVDLPFLIKQGFGGQEYRMTPEGKLIFARSGGPTMDCYNFTVNPAAGDVAGPPKLVTKSFYGHQKCPIYSPDGKRLAYIRNRTTLCIQSLADGTEAAFRPDMQYFDSIFWSPDSKTVALQGRGRTGPLGIHLFSLETREVTPLAADHAGVGSPKGFSADGKEFLFSRSKGQHWPFQSEHVAVDIATRKDRPVDHPPMKSDRIEEWAASRDGKQIAYVEKEQNGPRRNLVVSDAGFKDSKTIASASGAFLCPGWSPDGKTIAYHYSEKGGAVESSAELRLIAADGSWRKTPGTGRLKIFSTDLPPSWSPDGTKLALTLSESAPGEIGVLENFLPKKQVAAK